MNSVNHLKIKRFLNNELARRCDRNPTYSLRAFAKYLNVDYSTLSKILRGQINVGPRLAKRLSQRLGAEELEQATSINNIQPTVISEQDLTFAANWYHYAILELVHLPSFEPDLPWVAKRLGVSINLVRIAVEELTSIGLLEIKDHVWVDKSAGNTSSYNPKLSSEIRRSLQKSFMQKAIQQIDEVPFDFRDQSTLVLSLPKEAIPELKVVLKEFRRKFEAKAKNLDGADQAYALSISLYPLSQI